MTKCDFCTQSSPDGECFWTAKSERERYCKEAIKQMVKVLGQEEEEKETKKKRFWKKL